MTKVNIYYGGRGLIEDPTNYVMGKISEVLDELNIQVKKYNLYEDMQLDKLITPWNKWMYERKN